MYQFDFLRSRYLAPFFGPGFFGGNVIKFMDFLLEPESIAAVTNFARYAAGVQGVTELQDEELKTSPESVPPADAPPGTFIAVCDQETQEVYDAIWTRLKK